MRNRRWSPLAAVLLASAAALCQSTRLGPQSSATAMPLAHGNTGAAPQPLAKPANKKHKSVSFGADGLVFRSPDDKFELKVHGLVQGDSRYLSSDLQDRSKEVLLFRRVRPIFDGKLFGVLDYHFMPDFGQNTAVIQDAYLELRTPEFAKLRAGKFKTPVGLELLQADANGMFVERSLVSGLLPNRDLGIQLGGEIVDTTISYAVGYFKGVADGGNATFDWRDSNSAAARVFWQPFRKAKGSPLQGFGIGVGASAGHDNANVARYKTSGQNTLFKYSSSVVGRGQHNRFSPQAYYYHGPFEVMAEYALSSQDVGKSGSEARVRNQAWQTSVGYIVTGERASYNGVKPKRAFEPNRRWSNLGALELVARYSTLQFDNDIFTLALADPKTSCQKADAWAVGVNWYLNRFVKVMTDYEHTHFRMFGVAVPLHDENVVMSRVQLAF